MPDAGPSLESVTATAVRPQSRQSRWLLPQAPDPAAVAALCRELHLPELVCRLLVARGHRDIEDAKRYLRPRLEHLSDPSTLGDLDRAAERIVRAVRNRETILIHGDYDVDGICSTTILTRSLTWLGGAVVPFIPHRRDGYDLTAAGSPRPERRARRSSSHATVARVRLLQWRNSNAPEST